MWASYEKAVTVFESFDEALKAPTQHPFYIVNDARRNDKLRPVFFIYEETDAIFYHGVHLSAIEGEELYDLQSPYGYGGPIVSSEDTSFTTRANEAYIAWCQSQKIVVEFIRFHPLLHDWLRYYGEIINDRNTVWVDLNQNDLLMRYNVRARTAIRKAVKSELLIEWCNKTDNLYKFIDLYNSTMQELNADPFYSFKEEYYKDLIAWKGTHLAVCKYQNQIIASAIFLVESNIMEYHLSAANSIGKKFGATNLMLHEAAMMGQVMGCQTLHLGGGSDQGANNSLLFFKSGFSKHLSTFRIGRKIFLEETYESLKVAWEIKKGKKAEQILFYRF